jgi:HAD superfamily hydrolase (TIGR01490 family)
MTHHYCAIFDLDETLIRPKSMLSVLDAYYRFEAKSEADAESRIAQTRERLKQFVDANDDRREQNRYFYRQLGGIPVSAMRAAAQQWFTGMRPTIYHTAVVNELIGHQRDGAATILVTGSFREAVEPIARDLGIDHVICADLKVVDDRYTGELIGSPTIGQGKADALGAYFARNGMSFEDSYAYGDHDSDIPMLRLAATPVAVGKHPALVWYAESRRWRVLSHL